MGVGTKIKHQKDIISKCVDDIEFVKKWNMKYPNPKNNDEKKKLVEERKFIRTTIHQAIKENVLEIKERKFIKYRGFDIILPTNMKSEKPYVWLQNNGRYYVELGDTEVGNLVRIDNYLNNLNDHLKELEESLEKQQIKLRDIKTNLSKDENFYDHINHYRKLVEELDEKLGVNNNGK